MTRLPELDLADLSPEQRKVHDAILAGPRGTVRGPLLAWLHSAELADKAQGLGAFCRYDTSLPPRLSELAILVTGAHWRAGYEWHVHAPIGIKAGLDPAAVEAIRKREQPTLAREDEAAVHAFARELLEQHQVTEATYRRAAAALGARGVVELVGILGYYGLISMTIKAFELPLLEGAENPFPDPAAAARP